MIAILGRREDELQTTKREIKCRNRRLTVSIYLIDVNNFDAPQITANDIRRWHILVCNAGYPSDLPHLVQCRARRVPERVPGIPSPDTTVRITLDTDIGNRSISESPPIFCAHYCLRRA